MIFLLEDLIPTATLSSFPGTILSELPVDNLKSLSKARITRSATGGTVTITGELVDPSNISVFVIGQHTFQAGTIYQLELYYETDWSGTPITYDNDGPHTVSSTQAALDPNEFQYNIPVWTYYNNGIPVGGVNSFKLTLINPNVDYLQMGRLMMGNALVPRIGASYGHNLYWKENSNQYRTEAGTLRTDIQTPSKVIEFSLANIYESERSNIQRSLAGLGKRDEFYISLFPQDCSENKELDYSGIVKMTKIPRYPEYAPDFYSSKYAVEEI